MAYQKDKVGPIVGASLNNAVQMYCSGLIDKDLITPTAE
jgi:hypothetical protein